MNSLASMSIAGLSRRRWLVLATAAGASIAGGTWWWQKADVPADLPVRRFESFDQTQAAVLAAVAQAALPSGNGFPSIEQAQVLDRLDEEVYFVSADVRADIRTALDVLEYLPLVLGYASRFSELDSKRRTAVLRAGSGSRFEVLRAVCSSLRLMVQWMYFGHPATWKRIGYEGPFAGIEPQMSEQRIHFSDIRQGKVHPRMESHS